MSNSSRDGYIYKGELNEIESAYLKTMFILITL